jgi:hypothetical protein
MNGVFLKDKGGSLNCVGDTCKLIYSLSLSLSLSLLTMVSLLKVFSYVQVTKNLHKSQLFIQEAITRYLNLEIISFLVNNRNKPLILYSAIFLPMNSIETKKLIFFQF